MLDHRNSPGFVEIYEVGPRDGLQNEKQPIATADKIRLIDLLSRAGFRHIEAASFVSPKWVPQMADSPEVMAGIARNPGVVYAALVPNLQGYFGARSARAQEVAVFASASEGFSRKNINCSVEDSFGRFSPICAAAATDGIPVRGYVSCVIACPYDGPTPPGKVAQVAARLLRIGCREISLGDTIGVATPETVTAMLRAVLDEIPSSRLAGHFHDTNGLALSCIEAGLEVGVRVFDAAAGGAGGCPYAPGAPGNVATGRVADLLRSRGFETGIDASVLAEAEGLMLRLLGRPL